MSMFGMVNEMDDPLTEAQGLYMVFDQARLGFLQAMDLVFTSGREFNGSTLAPELPARRRRRGDGHVPVRHRACTIYIFRSFRAFTSFTFNPSMLLSASPFPAQKWKIN
jgi:hypothetical protein